MTRYLIGKGELLTYRIETPKQNPGAKNHPYSFEEAKSVILPQVREANEKFSSLPSGACLDDIVVSKVTLHPAYIAKSYFPRKLFDQAGLFSVGSRSRRILPRNISQSSKAYESDTTEIFVAGSKNAFLRFPDLVESLQINVPLERNPLWDQFRRIEEFSPMIENDRIKINDSNNYGFFEIVLHIPPGMNNQQVKSFFKDYAFGLGFQINEKYEFEAGKLLFLVVKGSSDKLESLAKFSLMRLVRTMPKIRGIQSLIRGIPSAANFNLPIEPISREPKVAVLDGGLPEKHLLENFVRRYFESNPKAQDDPRYIEHGLGVSSAILFGPIDPGNEISPPYSFIDHHRVLDSLTEEDNDPTDPYELYRTLTYIEEILLSRQYMFINLSLGPDLPIEDKDVHAWTSVIDSILSDGETLMSIAVGNNGEGDHSLALNRIQVPADSVNALSVGASDCNFIGWKRARYSARGPGRSPGRVKPDVMAFGGSENQYFHVIGSGHESNLIGMAGTSFAAPYALRSAIGVRAILGDSIHPLTIKGLLIHCSEFEKGQEIYEVGWGKVPHDINKIITCDVDGMARIIYQGELNSGKFLRAPVPLPNSGLNGKVRIKATFCYACPVDPQDTSSYTRAGLGITFRPNVKNLRKGSHGIRTKNFFPQAGFRSEPQLRSDLGKWETVLHAEQGFLGNNLYNPHFDIHYNARENGGSTGIAGKIRYSLIITITAPRNENIYQDILATHNVLQPIEPQISLPVKM